MAAAAPSAGVQKALQRVNAQVAAGAFYEAQQMYKTTYHRYHSRKQPAEAYEVLREGATQQLRSGQVTCGTELASMLVDAYNEDKVPAAGAAADSLCDIVRAMPSAPAGSSDSMEVDVDEAAVDACSRFVTQAVKWLHRQGADADVRRVHDLFAAHLVAAYGWRLLGRASVHYARGADAGAFAAALAKCSAAAPPAERDLFVARAVLQTLACSHPATAGRQLGHAAAVLDACKAAAWPGGGRGPADAPLVHFCGFLLTALQKRSVQLVQLLRAKYAASLGRDPALEAYLSRVEEVYLQVGGGGGGGLLAGLLRGLLEGDEEE
jgi:hypothetical protein